MKRILILTGLLVAGLATLAAQQDPVAILEYFDDDFELEIIDDNGFDVNFYIGMGLSPGDRVITGNTSAEIRLQPNGSIVRIAPDTTFEVESIQGRNEAQETTFGVAAGRMRMVAARVGGNARYSVRTPSAVAGVRGTDFGVTVVPPAEGIEAVEELFVFEGEVSFEAQQTGQQIFLSAGQRADVFAQEFLPVPMSQAEIQARRGNLDFQQLNPVEVPGQQPEEVAEIQDVQPEDVEAVGPAEPEPQEAEPGLGDQMFERLAEITGLQVGSVTINEQTYAQVVFQPLVSIGRLQLALYLPFTYSENLFDPGDWYRPDGNDEWSFGTDQDWERDPLDALYDVGRDTVLKIRSLEWAERGDPFFLKVGNLSTFTIGQGLLMRNYANDVDFPAVRRVGVNIGFDRGSWGLEAMTNDLAAPEIFGGRLFFRPAAPNFNAAVGFSAVSDIAPASEISPDETNPLFEQTRDGDPLFLNVAADLELPLIDRDLLALIGYAEAGGLIPYVRDDADIDFDDDGTVDDTVSAGIKNDALVDFSSGELKNFGWKTGVRGNVLFLDYLLEFRSYDGIFRPSFYGPSYDRLRGTIAAETIGYLADTEADEYQQTTLGIAGEAGASIFNLVYLSAGYFWPWEVTESGDWQGSNNDELVVTLELRDGLIPFGIEAGLAYQRTNFAATLAGWNEYEDATLFDASTTLDGYVAYPVNSFIDLVARVSTAAVRDEDGNIVYDNNGNPKMAPTVAIQTQVGL